MSNRPKILVTNDDGISAKGIKILMFEMCKLGEVYVVAPDRPQSGKAHAITIDTILGLNYLKSKNVMMRVSCNGTPVDCVKLAINEVLKTKPDLCVSGINHGSNSSINVIYSGTMGAVIEAGIVGIPSIGFSLDDHSENADFSKTRSFIYSISKRVLELGLPEGIVLNVNFPKASEVSYRGIKVCRQAKVHWIEKFNKKLNPMGKAYFWLSGDVKKCDLMEDTDEYWLSKNYISLVPITFDLTAHNVIEELNTWDFN